MFFLCSINASSRNSTFLVIYFSNLSWLSYPVIFSLRRVFNRSMWFFSASCLLSFSIFWIWIFLLICTFCLSMSSKIEVCFLTSGNLMPRKSFFPGLWYYKLSLCKLYGRVSSSFCLTPRLWGSTEFKGDFGLFKSINYLLKTAVWRSESTCSWFLMSLIAQVRVYSVSSILLR